MFSNLITKLLLVTLFLTAFLGVNVNGVLGTCYVNLHHEAPYIHTGETLQFSATTTPPWDCSTPCYNWEITEVGSDGSNIDANGLYTAGDTPGTDLVTVTDACNGDISDSVPVSVGPTPTSTYQFERMWPPLKPSYYHEIWHIAVDSDGFVYVPDVKDSCIKKFTSDGQFVTKWGNYGSGDGEFDRPGWIAVDNNGFVYVVDYWNHRVQKFTSDGQFVTKWGSLGSGDGQFDGTGSIAVDGNGFVYVVDYSPDGRVQKFTPDGQFVTKWGGSYCRLYDGGGCEDPDGDGPLELGDGQFYFPHGIAIDIDGFVYISDDNRRIQKFTQDGQFVTKWGSECNLRNGYGCEDPDGDGPLELGDGQFDFIPDIAVDSNGFVYAADGSGNERIQVFTSDGQFVGKWGSYGHADDELYDPSDIAVDNNGFVYVVAYSSDYIKKFTSDGQFIDKWQSYGDGDGEFVVPDEITIDTNGFVYVYDYRVQKFSPEGQFLEELQNHGKLKAVDDNNFFYYVDSTVEDGIIKKVTSDGEIVSQWGSLGTEDGELEVVQDIAVDNSGYVYVLDSDTDYYHGIEHHRVQKFTSDGQFVTKWGSYCRLYDGGGCRDSDGDGPLERGDGQFFFPRSITVDMNGFVYVSDRNSRIQKFTSDGQFVDKWNAYCEDLAIGSKGFLYCTYTDKDLITAPSEYIPQHILKFTLEGQFVGKWGSFGSGPGQMAGIGDIAVGPNEKIYIADFFNHRVQVFEENSITCESDYDCDGDVDGTDAALFKVDFGRNLLFYPCDEINPCRGDFDCDQDVDGTDVDFLKQDFGRTAFNNPCPSCTVGEWCSYP